MPDLNFEDQLTDSVKTLWRTRISNLSSLKEHLLGAILVAFDTAGGSREFGGIKNTSNVSELGFSALCTDIATSPLGSNGLDFSEANDTRNLTIQLHRRGKGVERTSGRILHAQATDVEDLVQNFFTDLPGRRILVMYDPRQELKWITSTLPCLADMFDAMVDVQELVDHRSLESRAAETCKQERMGLRSALIAMRFPKPAASATRPVNDCCRILQVLGGLVQSRPFNLPEARSRFSFFDRLPKRRKRHPFALRIKPSDEQRLPPWRPEDVAAAFKDHKGLCGVGLNWKNPRLRQEGVRVWWLLFCDYQTMHTFYNSMDGQEFEGLEIRVIPDFEEMDIRNEPVNTV
ncbi:hypothetical protein K491DRAFT_681601 [Lophiostoma macrostomum CBS 122681]|uniref:Uncharacterized protein n=1 Tax=Lophiostoma macrostomum CBS 122681 TaxID=1314788 RepID=A0A6A6SX09_9PLEO|nr:hypothetical protein K491DRAFT_681601 [Lophiostoma macrostomum CBS 122681]